MHSSPNLDVRQISTGIDGEGPDRDRRGLLGLWLNSTRRPSVPLSRRLVAWLILVIGLPVLLASMKTATDHLAVGAALLVTLLLTVVVAAIGGQLPGLTGAVIGALSVNFVLVPPYGTLDVSDPDDTVSLAVFVLVAIIVSTLVNQATRRAVEAMRARQDAQSLSRTAMVLASSQEPLSALAREACTVLDQRAVAIFERSDDGGWLRLATAGEYPPADISDGTAHPVDPIARHVLVLHGKALDPNGVDLLNGLADQITVALESIELRREAAEVEILSRANELRNAILHAVSHDLRTPLTGIKASVTSLLSPEVKFSADDTTQLLSTIDEQVDRLDRVVGNLLDMSRLQSGVLRVHREHVMIDDVVAAAVGSLGMDSRAVLIEIPEDLPPVLIDSALAERAVANVIANAAEVQPEGIPIRVDCSLAGADQRFVELRVSDRGPGIPVEDRQIAVLPFQRLSDTSRHQGVGLGLAIASGLTAALGGQMELDDNPDGGLTVKFVFPKVGDDQLEGPRP